MAQGSVTTFEEFRKTIGDGSHDLDNDSFKIMLITNTTVPTAADATPDSADYTEVTGTGYTAGGEAVTVTWTEAAGTATFATTSSAAWTQNGAGPTNIYYGIIYNTTHVGTNDAIGFIDMTADGGTTPISLQDGDITINSGTVFTLA
jgi:hypothetical protein